MDATRREFLRGSLGFAVAANLDANAGARQPAPHAPQVPYGSGHFGQWIDDEFGLPAFRYTCNQVNDPLAETPLKPGILGSTEHLHQVGNDRITALASNFGHLRVRQDEGCPKILNDLDPETSQFAGGIGYLTDGQESLGTWYDGSDVSFERIFGVGYFRKRVSGKSCAVDQVIFAPFGDDPVLLSQVTITNRKDVPVTVRWVEYWGCQSYQFSYRAGIEAQAGMGTPTELRRRFGRRFSHRISAIEGQHGLLDEQHFPGRPDDEAAAWEEMKAKLKAHPTGFQAPIPDLLPGTYYESVDLPRTFLVSLDGPASGFSTNAAAFFGSGGVSNPSGLGSELGAHLEESGEHTGFLLERTVHLAPKAARTLHFMYGYLPEGFTLDALLAKYRTVPAAAWQRSSGAWKQHGLRFEVPGEPWIDRESRWNHYYLRSSQTFDDFFAEHILNQNGLYEYVLGFQGAARDPLQHSLPFLFSDPEIVRSILRYTLKEVRDDGSIPYGIVGHGVVMPTPNDNSSDIPLWLLWTVSEYVLATRDAGFLDEKIPARFSAQPGRTETVRNLLARCYHHQVYDVGVGQHGIVKMLNDDWNDGLLFTWAQSAFKESVEQGESVLDSAMSAWVFDEYARMLRSAGDHTGVIEKLSASAASMRKATQEQWTGQWLKRAWLGPTLGWLGETTLWVAPQPWAILAGITSPSQSRELVKTMNAQLRRGPTGAAQMGEGPDMTKPGLFEPGTCVRGGVWPSLNQTLIWALAQVDPAMAWDEWKKNSFARHADVYPDIWYGVWSGPDNYNSSLSKHPGATVEGQFFNVVQFPVLNLHSHACALYSITKVLNVDFTEDGLSLSPDLPVDSYRFDSPLLGVAKQGPGHFEGWYAPSKPGTWTLKITLPEQTAKAASHAEINGTATPVKKQPGGTILLTGSSEQHKPLRWALW